MNRKIPVLEAHFGTTIVPALVLITLICFEIRTWGGEPPVAGLSKAGLLRHGRFVYERNCTTCHGIRGDGQGEMAHEIIPKPRSFVSGIFKYKSTPRASLPLDEDLYRTIRSGIAGTSMPAFIQLTESDVQGVVEYIKSFSKVWKGDAPKPVQIEIPTPPDWFGDFDGRGTAFEKGARLFQESCVPCHHQDASAGSATSLNLQDVWGNPSPAPNLRTSTPRISRNSSDLYRLLREGVAGTPMPGFSDSLSPAQIWELIVWIQEPEKPLDPRANGKGLPKDP